MKRSISIVDGWGMVERMSWSNYNESRDVVRDIGCYRNRYEVYPESVHAGKFYRTKDNRRWCNRFSGDEPRKAAFSFFFAIL